MSSDWWDSPIVTPVSEIKMSAWKPWQYMDCPACGARTQPYGGFGGGKPSNWPKVGKYSCHKTPECSWWYADPKTGIHYERTSRGIQPMRKERS